MTSSRKIIGLIGLLFLLGIYCAICVFIATEFLPENRLVELIFYPVVGVIWIFPAAKIVRWMQTPADLKE